MNLAQFFGHCVPLTVEDGLSLLAGDILSPPYRIAQLQEENERIISNAIDEAPHVAYDPIDAVNELEFHWNIAQFRDERGATRVEIALLAPFKKNLVDKFSSEFRDTLSVRFDGLIRDREFDPLVKDSMKITIPVKLATLEDLPNAIGKLVMTAPPQESELTMQVKDARNGGLGFIREPFTIRDFSGGNLMISDIQFFVPVTNANQRKILPTVQKQAMEVAPYPYEHVRKSTPLVCYFEIYNLKTAGITDEYKITYKLVQAKERDNLFKKVFKLFGKDQSISISYDQQVVDDVARELITIDLRKISTGPYRFEISVRDKKDKKISTMTYRDIMVVD